MNTVKVVIGIKINWVNALKIAFADKTIFVGGMGTKEDDVFPISDKSVTRGELRTFVNTELSMDIKLDSSNMHKYELAQSIYWDEIDTNIMDAMVRKYKDLNVCHLPEEVEENMSFIVGKKIMEVGEEHSEHYEFSLGGIQVLKSQLTSSIGERFGAGIKLYTIAGTRSYTVTF